MKSTIILILFLHVKSLLGCVHDGKNYKDGETWVEKDAFLMRCRMPGDGSWMVEITGCKTPSGNVIAINSSVIDGNYEWKCSKNNDGQIVMQKVPNVNAKCGDKYSTGEQWREKSFLYECAPGGQQKLVACIAEDNERINIGESKEINGYIVKCEKYPNGTVVIHGIRRSVENGTMFQVECIDSKGEHHAANSWWIDDHRFNKTCLSTGKIEVLNCISKNGIKIPLNQEVIIDDMKFLCEKTKDSAIRFASGPVDQIGSN